MRTIAVAALAVALGATWCFAEEPQAGQTSVPLSEAQDANSVAISPALLSELRTILEAVLKPESSPGSTTITSEFDSQLALREGDDDDRHDGERHDGERHDGDRPHGDRSFGAHGPRDHGAHAGGRDDRESGEHGGPGGHGPDGRPGHRGGPGFGGFGFGGPHGPGMHGAGPMGPGHMPGFGGHHPGPGGQQHADSPRTINVHVFIHHDFGHAGPAMMRGVMGGRALDGRRGPPRREARSEMENDGDDEDEDDDEADDDEGSEEAEEVEGELESLRDEVSSLRREVAELSELLRKQAGSR